MTVAVLKNRILDLTQRRFHERQFGAETFLDFVRGASALVRIDETRSPALVEFVGEPAPGTSIGRRDSGIRPDLWRAVMDYASRRMSRKLIFAAGLVLCLGCKLRPPQLLDLEASTTDDDYASLMAEHVLSSLDQTPLEILAWACEEFRASAACVNDLFGSYDEFLGMMNSTGDRESLDRIRPEHSQADSLFQRSRAIW